MAANKKIKQFSGFPRQTPMFLRDLHANNDKTWFEAHRDEYDAYFMAPARSFVAAIGERITSISSGVQAVPKVNGSIMRINRDTRFSKDKTPYKTHLDLMFWEGEGRARECPAFVFRLTADGLIVGAGKHGFSPEMLKAYRAAVDDDDKGSALAEVIATLTDDGAYTIGGDAQTRVPRGYPKDHARADLLRRKSVYLSKELGLPEPLYSAACVELCLTHYRAIAPLHKWLVALHNG